MPTVLPNTHSRRAFSRLFGRTRPAIGYIAAGVMALCVICTAVRALGITNGPLTIIVALTPLVCAGYLVVLFLSALARSETLAVLSALGVLVHVAWVAPLYVPDQVQNRAGVQLTVMTTNTRNGRGDPRAITSLVSKHKVDLLAVQELTPTALGRLHAAGLDRLLPYRSVMLTPPDAGTGIWSRAPLTNPSRIGSKSPYTSPNLRATTRLAGTTLTFVSVHPFPQLRGYDGWAASDQEVLRKDLGRIDGTAIVGGDFNATWDHPQLRKIYRLGYQDATDLSGTGAMLSWPALGSLPPLAGLDHILVKGDLGVVDLSRHRIPGSDHYALIGHIQG